MEPLAEMMEQAWSSLEEVCSALEPAEWELPTDCPGWTVRDQLAHIAAIEGRLLGRTPAPGDPVRAPHVQNDLGALNELEIVHRRRLTPEEILDEYREVTAERAKVLASWTAEQWDEVAPGPLGAMPRREQLKIRILDVHYHEQDVRVAAGRPGHMRGDVARLIFERMAAAMPFVVGKRAAAAEDQTVLFDVGAPGEPFAIGVRAGRGAPIAPVPVDPTVRLAMDGETFLRLCGGRWAPRRVEEEGRLVVLGDRDLANRVLAGMAVTP